MQIKRIFIIPLLISFVGMMMWSCLDLMVVNPNDPDTERVLVEAEDIESLIAGSFVEHWLRLAHRYPHTALEAMADVGSSSFHGQGQGQAAQIPRITWDNSAIYADRWISESPWRNNYTALSMVYDGLRAIERGVMDELDEELIYRARAFAKFVQGVTHGFNALHIDQGYIVDETIDLTELDRTKFFPYEQILEAAISYFEEAIRIAQEGPNWTIPDTWIHGVSLGNQEFVRLIHTKIARHLVMVARTPEERAAVDWNRVLFHLDNGIDYTFNLEGDGSLDPWRFDGSVRGNHPNIMRVSYFLIGRLDQSGQFEEWLRTPESLKEMFILDTPDRRVQGEDGPESDGTDIAFHGLEVAWPIERYPGQNSAYVHTRYDYYRGTYSGPIPYIKEAEIDLMRAEALWRLNSQGNRQAVVDLINKYHVGRGQMEPLNVNDSDEWIWEMLKYNKLIETMHNGFSGGRFFDQRGWGDLQPLTQLHFPVPGRELELVDLPIYTHGGGIGDSAPAYWPNWAINLGFDDMWRGL